MYDGNMSRISDKNLIFLISQPRAGSTLLQVMLAGHPEIATTSEPWIALHPIFALKDEGIIAVYGEELARNALQDFLSQSGVNTDFYKARLGEFLLSLYAQAASFQDKRYFLDKTPRYYHIIPELMELFPEARFIVLLRNPLDVLDSILKAWIRNDILELGTFREDLLVAPRRLMASLKEHPSRCFMVRYEELVSDPEQVLKGVCGFLGLSYADGMLDYGERLDTKWRLGDTTGLHRSFRPNTGSIDKWKRGFDTPQKRHLAVSYLDALGKELFSEMGYDFDGPRTMLDLDRGDGEGEIVTWKEIMEGENIERLRFRRKTPAEIVLDALYWKLTSGFRAVTVFFKKRLFTRG